MADPHARLDPAFYARRGGRASDWWTMLHPPYTLWHLSYCAVGAALAPSLDWVALGATVLAFFLAVGVAAHALDELTGRPLRTSISDRMLWWASVVALAGATGLGVAGVARGAWVLAVAIPVGVVLVLGYNLELLGGRLHTDLGFGLAWGGFPVVVSLVAQQPAWSWSVVAGGAAAAVAATALSYAQRMLSNPARTLRRRTGSVSGRVTLSDGTSLDVDRGLLLAPLEGALRWMSFAVPLVAGAMLLTHVG